ncbi:carbon-nitrogen family hydrolase [Halocatena pleomorpha]|uniref:Carbon-nitrogen family hydrolase n=1 Tax=Halocatena pleomorpha TaxID=1785090 RepID=A0A3P3R650_9EURY|nr:carbon-nitrogen family hydrolase [Halocatena pleomorpha]RRJ28952.1 carbon-nitrogen family hydrolase [Halocatena pleomorpha]
MKIALAQLRIEPGDVAGNVDRAEAAIVDAADRGVDVVCLPEAFTVGYFSFSAYAEHAEGLSGPTLSRLSAAARENNIAVVAGTIIEDLTETDAGPAATGLANTAVFFDRDGTRKAVYRKRHLFGYDSRESELLVPGERLPTVSFEGFTVGLTTCYDLRFPELYRSLLDAGVTLVFVPSAWPYPRVEHWKLLAKARAVENLWYVAATNGTGAFEDATLLGRSTVYDPWGTAVASAGADPTLVTATIDPDRVDSVRAEFPALDDRR